MSCDCGCETKKYFLKKEFWMTGIMNVFEMDIPVVDCKLKLRDILGGWLARWSINRDRYNITPGLYAIGCPDKNSVVLATANYKLSFDKLRKELTGLDAWILVLDTRGINVWCAAGKGTFGTEELIKKIVETRLKDIIDHRNIILPQLGAVGVQAHVVRNKIGFNVIYGPVYAKYIKEFIENGFKKDQKMTIVKFNLIDRLAVTPVEIVSALKYIIPVFLVIGIFDIVMIKNISAKILIDFIPILGAFLSGLVLFPVLLPIIPFKSFSIKGAILGLVWALLISYIYKISIGGYIANALLFTPITSFFALNFTGSTTFTSLSGVKLEFKYSIPVMIIILRICIKNVECF
jgi:hypothetical protein